MAMWFRKRLKNRKILAWHVDWPSLRLALELTPRDTPPCGNYLILDCRSGMTLAETLSESFTQQPDWPALDDVLDEADIWRDYPHISPPLRKALAKRSRDEAHKLYFSVASGTAETFYLPKTPTGFLPPVAWDVRNAETFVSALDAANAYGERTLFPLLEMEENKPERTLLKRARKKIMRNMTRLNEEQKRLQSLADEQSKGEALQAELYRLKNAEGLEAVEVEHPAHGRMTVPLNPHLTVTENMEKYFRLAAKAQRGFPHLKRRRKELLDQLDNLENGWVPELDSGHASKAASPAPPSLPKRYKGLAISLFRSSDGFTIIRGKNKKANHDILSKAASPFDYWFHVADGPSSHVILKRDHPDHEVPDSTLTQAAILCGLKSYRKDDGKADIMYALVKDVRKVKGFAHGQVMVDKKLGTLRVELDDSLEKALA